jgi:hypothetical protein
MVVVLVKLPDAPVTVMVAAPVEAEALAVKVSVLVEVAGFGLKLAVTPLGSPEAEKLTCPLKPFAAVMLMVLSPLLPCTTLKVLGDAEIV